MFGGKSDAELKVYFNDVHCYNLDTNEWFTLPTEGKIPSVRCWHSAALQGDTMIIFGGFFWNGRYETWPSPLPPTRDSLNLPHVSHREHYYNSTFLLDLQTRKWTEVKPIGEPPSERNRTVCLLLPLRPDSAIEANEENENKEKENEGGKRRKTQPCWSHQLWVQGGNYFNEKTRRGFFYADSWVLRMEGENCAEWEWRKATSQGDRIPERAHHSMVIGDGGLDEIFIFGGEKKRARFNDVLKVILLDFGTTTHAVTTTQQASPKVEDDTQDKGKGRGRGRGGRGGSGAPKRKREK